MRASARNIYICLFIFLCSISAYTQTAWIDSVKKVLSTQKEDTNKVNTLLNLSGAYRFSYPDSSLKYAQQALAISEKLHDDNDTFWASNVSFRNK